MDIPPLDQNPRKQEEGVGPLIGIIIIVALVALGGIYFLYMQEAARHNTPTDTQANVR